jgi:hypothetical protein
MRSTTSPFCLNEFIAFSVFLRLSFDMALDLAGRDECLERQKSCVAARLLHEASGAKVKGFPFLVVCRYFTSGRCWVRTSDLCRVKAGRYYRACSPLFKTACRTAYLL